MSPLLEDVAAREYNQVHQEHTVAVVNRRRGGGTHKYKKGKAEERRAVSAKGPEPLQVEEGIYEMITCILEGRDVAGEQRAARLPGDNPEVDGMDKGQMENIFCTIRQVVEEKRERGPGAGRRAGARQESAFQRRETARGDASAEHQRTRRDEWF